MRRAAAPSAVVLGLVAAFSAASCGAAATPSASVAARSVTPAAAASAAGSELERVKARGTLVVGIRVEAPPPNRAAGDPAHAQKRALETAVATLIATSVLGPTAKVELRSQGGDRVALLDQGADIAMTVDTTALRDRALVSVPYAKSAIVLAAKKGGPVRRVEDVAGKTVAVAQDELGARDIAEAFFGQRGMTVILQTGQGVNGAVAALEADRAAAIVGDRIGVDLVASERALAVVAEVAPRPYVIATRKNAPDLASAIDAALRAALASGAIRDAALKAGFPYQAP